MINAAWSYDLLITLLSFGRERKLRERLLAPARLAAGESVLDIGCGTGSVAIAAAAQVGPLGSVHGIDPSPAMVGRARAKAARAKVTASFDVAFAQSLPFADGRFDVVVSTVMLHHLPRAGRDEALREARRVLKPGGRLLAIDFGVEPGGEKGLLGRLHGTGGMTASYLAELAKTAGLEVVDGGPLRTWDLQFVLARRAS